MNSFSCSWSKHTSWHHGNISACLCSVWTAALRKPIQNKTKQNNPPTPDMLLQRNINERKIIWSYWRFTGLALSTRLLLACLCTKNALITARGVCYQMQKCSFLNTRELWTLNGYHSYFIYLFIMLFCCYEVFFQNTIEGIQLAQETVFQLNFILCVTNLRSNFLKPQM